MKTLWILTVLTIALAGQSSASAQGPHWGYHDRGPCAGSCGEGVGMPFGRGMGERRGGGEGFMDALEEIDLSNEQIDKIKAIRENAHKLNIPLRGQLELKQVEIRELMNGDKPDKEKVAARIKEMEAIKVQMDVNRSNAHIDVISQLTKDQRNKIEKEMFGRGGPGKKKMKRFMED